MDAFANKAGRTAMDGVKTSGEPYVAPMAIIA